MLHRKLCGAIHQSVLLQVLSLGRVWVHVGTNISNARNACRLLRFLDELDLPNFKQTAHKRNLTGMNHGDVGKVATKVPQRNMSVHASSGPADRPVTATGNTQSHKVLVLRRVLAVPWTPSGSTSRPSPAKRTALINGHCMAFDHVSVPRCPWIHCSIHSSSCTHRQHRHQPDSYALSLLCSEVADAGQLNGFITNATRASLA